MRLGEHLTKLAEKIQGNTDFSAYRDIVDNGKPLTKNRRNLLKAVVASIISWLDCENKDRVCICGLKPALFQNHQSCDLFYGCVKIFSDKENRCAYSRNLWMSQYRMESDPWQCAVRVIMFQNSARVACSTGFIMYWVFDLVCSTRLYYLCFVCTFVCTRRSCTCVYILHI